MKRWREWAAIALAATVAAGMWIATGPDDPWDDRDRVSVRFWNGFTGPDGRTMLRIVRRFNRENPDIHVQMQRMDWGTYYNKLYVAGLGGRAPEVFVVHAGNLARFERAGFLEDLGDLVRSPGFRADRIDAGIREAVTTGDRILGVPLDIHMMGMYYNRRLLQEAGLTAADGTVRPPATREEFLTALERLKRDTDGDGRPDQWGFVFTNFRSNVTAVMHQFGARFFDRDYTHCTLDSPEAVAALAFCADLIHRYELVPLPENIDAWIGFRQGKVGMVFEGVYMLADLRRQQDLDFGGAPVPLLGREPATWCDSHVLCVRRGTNPEHLEAAQRLITFLSENSLDWAEGGQVPVRRDLRETIRFQEMPVQAAFAQQIPYSKYPPRVPFVFEFYSEFDLAIERVLRGSAEPEQALTAAAAKINEAMARDRRNNPRTRAAQPEPPSTTDRGGTP